MLSWLKENASLARDRMTAEASKFKNRSFMEAVVAGCALVAAADGTISAEEKQKMAGFVSRADELKHFEMAQVIEVFNKVSSDFDFDALIGKGSALKIIGKIKDKPDQAKLLIRVVCAIGAADGDFDEDEQAVVREICNELNLSPSNFDL